MHSGKNYLVISNRPADPFFIIKEDKYFEAEKTRLTSFINKMQEPGEHYFEGKESHSFYGFHKSEWDNMFYKHVDHHLRQFEE
jgi:hypothetical protein